MSDLEPPRCWFASTFADAGACEGRLVRCHLIPRQQMRRHLMADRDLTVVIADPRGWVYGCGGALGPGGHHGKYKPDGPRRIPRSLLPPGLEAFALELGLDWWLHRTYGPLCDLCGDSEVVYVNPGYPDPQTETDYPCPKCSQPHSSAA